MTGFLVRSFDGACTPTEARTACRGAPIVNCLLWASRL